MKILVIGVDGLDQRLVENMDMPFMQQQLKRHIPIKIEEDLWSRGWAATLCGKHGHHTGAFYGKPELNGTHNTTNRFNFNEIGTDTNILPLWKLIADSNLRVGFMNIPGMNPAPIVNGFAVSGGGAGSNTSALSGKEGVPDGSCYPKKIKSILEKNSYILDTRYSASGIKNKDTLFAVLEKMEINRTLSFVELSNEFEIDFGYIAYMSTKVIQYLAMSEIEDYIGNAKQPRNELQRKIVRLYRSLDDNIRNLVDSLNPDHVLYVSDHGGSPRLHNINLNSWLAENGYLTEGKKSISVAKSFLASLRPYIPKGVKKAVRRNIPTLTSSIYKPSINWSRTSAFGARYIPGIYINDSKRFEGPIDAKDVELYAQKIIQDFNNDMKSIKHNLKARLYRANYKNEPKEAFLPDIWIDHPDSMFFEDNGGFIDPNSNYGTIEKLDNISQDQHTGVKGRYPLLIVDKELYNFISDDDVFDLTLVYKIIARRIKNENWSINTP